MKSESIFPDLSISHRHIPPGCPEVNGKVERSHKTDADEFYREKTFHNKEIWPES